MNLLEVLAEIVEGHVGHSEIVGTELALKLLLLAVSHQLAPKRTILAAGSTLPPTFSPGIAYLHQLVVHALGVLQQRACQLSDLSFTKV